MVNNIETLCRLLEELKLVKQQNIEIRDQNIEIKEQNIEILPRLQKWIAKSWRRFQAP